MRAANQPVNWWGWHWEPPVPLSPVEMLRAANMPPRLLSPPAERGAERPARCHPEPSGGQNAPLTVIPSRAGGGAERSGEEGEGSAASPSGQFTCAHP